MSSHKGILINLSMSLKTQLRMFGKAYGRTANSSRACHKMEFQIHRLALYNKKEWLHTTSPISIISLCLHFIKLSTHFLPSQYVLRFVPQLTKWKVFSNKPQKKKCLDHMALCIIHVTQIQPKPIWPNQIVGGLREGRLNQCVKGVSISKGPCPFVIVRGPQLYPYLI